MSQNIDIRTLGIQGQIVVAASSTYDGSIARPSTTSVLRPAYIVYPQNSSDVVTAIQFAQSTVPPLTVAIKSGGCHTSNISSIQDGLVIDLSGLKSVTVSEDKQTVRVGGGAVWGDVYSTLTEHNLVAVGCNIWFVGVGGFTTGGGWSNLSGEYGLAIDNLVGATVVLADGKIVKTSDTEEPDLFWAIRGGSNQFGVITEFVYRVHPAPGPVLVGALAYPGTELGSVLKALHVYLKTHTPKSKLILSFMRTPPHFYPSVAVIPYIEGDAAFGEETLAPFKSGDLKPAFEQTGCAPDQNAVGHSADASMAGAPPRHITGGVLFSDIWDDLILRTFEEWAAFTENPDRKAGIVFWEFGHRDKISQVPKDAMAFVARDPHYYVAFTGQHSSPDSDKPTEEYLLRMTQLVADTNEQRTGVRLPPPLGFVLGPGFVKAEEVYETNLPRLRKLKARYDPKKVWNKGLTVIEPDFSI